MRSLEIDEEDVVSSSRAFALKVGRERRPHIGGEWKDTVLAAFAMNAKLVLDELDVAEADTEHFPRPQTAQEHECGDGEVSKRSKAFEEPNQFISQ